MTSTVGRKTGFVQAANILAFSSTEAIPAGRIEPLDHRVHGEKGGSLSAFSVPRLRGVCVKLSAFPYLPKKLMNNPG
jgi:hypothetical protein